MVLSAVRGSSLLHSSAHRIFLLEQIRQLNILNKSPSVCCYPWKDVTKIRDEIEEEPERNKNESDLIIMESAIVPHNDIAVFRTAHR